jgi:hypothetical protein
MFRSGALLLFLALAATLSAPCAGYASSIFHHQEMTEQVLTDLGWTDMDAIRKVAEASMATDLGRLPAYSRAATNLLLPEAGKQVPLVRELSRTAPFSPEVCKGFHFNSLYSYSDIERRWEELAEWVDGTCEYIALLPAEERRPMYLAFLGMTLHMVQDFYSHSNWVGLLNGYSEGDLDPATLPTWEELIHDQGSWHERNPGFPVEEAMHRLRLSDIVVRDDEHLGGLQTGSIRHEHFIGLKPWSHRHARGAEQAVVHELARRTSRTWVIRIEARMGTLEAFSLPEMAWSAGDADGNGD